MPALCPETGSAILFDFISVAFANLFRKPATRNYPKIVREPFAGCRGHVENNISGCIFCGICSRKCPVTAISVARDKHTWSIDRFKCITCGECASSCPKKCLSLRPEYTAPAGQKTVEHYVFQPETTAPEKKPPVHVVQPSVSDDNSAKISVDSVRSTAGHGEV